MAAHAASTSSPTLAEWWEPLLDVAPLTRPASAGRCCCTSVTSACSIDFPAGTVREWAGEPVGYRIDTDRALVESCIERHVEDWVNELFLSCRFRAHRDGPYNEYVYTFFKCLSLERMAYCEGHYASRSRAERRDVPLRRLPGAEAVPAPARPTSSGSGRCEDGILECMVHHWQFDLATGPLPHLRRRRAPAAHDPIRITGRRRAHRPPRPHLATIELLTHDARGAGRDGARVAASTRCASPSTTCAGRATSWPTRRGCSTSR